MRDRRTCRRPEIPHHSLQMNQSTVYHSQIRSRQIYQPNSIKANRNNGWKQFSMMFPLLGYMPVSLLGDRNPGIVSL